MAAERLAMRQIREILRQKCGVLQPRHGVSHGADQSLEEGHRRQVSEKPLHPSGAFAWLGLGRPPRSEGLALLRQRSKSRQHKPEMGRGSAVFHQPSLMAPGATLSARNGHRWVLHPPWYPTASMSLWHRRRRL